MNSIQDLLNSISIERPVGTPSNNKILDLLKTKTTTLGYNTKSLPINCNTWEQSNSLLTIGDKNFIVYPSPFSEKFNRSANIIIIDSLQSLEESICENKILIITGDLVKEPLQPKNFPFYFPDEHKKLINLIEEKNPLAIIAATGKHPFNNTSPYYIFEDGNFLIPNAYMSNLFVKELSLNTPATLTISSKKELVESKQFIFIKKSTNTSNEAIIFCAHMDSKYNTPGALDNATGVVILLNIMEKLKDIDCNYDIHFVFFNTEEYYGATGELAYLDYIKQNNIDIKLVINIDSPCHIDSKTAISTYNSNEKILNAITQSLQSSTNIIEGDQWYSGNHSMFVFSGIPCIAVTSSNLTEEVMALIHTKQDTVNNINTDLIYQTSEFLIDVFKSFIH